MKPLFDLVAPSQGMFAVAVLFLLFARIMYFEKAYTGRISNDWNKSDIATKWIVERFFLRFAPATALAIGAFFLASENLFEGWKWTEESPALSLFVLTAAPMLLWTLLTFYSLCIACECCIFKRQTVLDEIESAREMYRQRHGKNVPHSVH